MFFLNAIALYDIVTNTMVNQETINGQQDYQYARVFTSDIILNNIIDLAIDNLDKK